MSIFRTSMEFMQQVYQHGLKKFKAPEPIETDVLCDELKITFHRKSTTFELIQKGLVIGEMEIDSRIDPGDTISLTQLKLYWGIELR